MSLINLKYQQNRKIAIITLNRPKVHNAINEEMMERLEQILDDIYGDEQIRVIILAASGSESFCAGGDLKYFTTLTTRQQALEMSRRMQNLLDRLWQGTKPVIAAINGQALGGGCELISACHFRICVKQTRFSYRQAANGIITGWGGGGRLLEAMGRRALYFLLSSDWIDADRALAVGFIDLVVEDHDLLPVALQFAGKIAENPEAPVTSFLNLHRIFLKQGAGEASQFETNTFADLWVRPDFQNWLKSYVKSGETREKQGKGKRLKGKGQG